MWRLRDGEEVLGVAALGAAEGADVAGTPRLLGQPLAGVVAVLQFAPAEGAVADPSAFGEVRAAKIDERDNVAGLGKLGGGPAGACATEVGIALLEDGGPGAVAGRNVKIGGEALTVAHGDHLVALGDGAEVEVGLGGGDVRDTEQ